MSADPSDIQAQLEALNRRRQLAEALAQQSGQPQQQQVVNGRVMDQGFAPALRGITSLIAQGQANRAADKSTQLQQQQQSGITSAIGDYQNAPPEGKAVALQRLQRLSNTPSTLAQSIIQQATAPKSPTILKEGETAYQPNGSGGYSPIPGMSAPPKAKSLQKTDSGLNFNPDSGKYSDSSGKELSTDEVSSRETELAANKTAATEAARNKAKLSALPKGSIDAQVESYMQTGSVPSGIARSPAMSSLFWQGVSDRAVKDGNSLAAQTAQTRMRASLKPAMEQTQKQLAANQGFLSTLDKNIASADEFAQRVGGDGSPAMNAIFNKWKRGVTGDPDVAAMDFWNNSITGEAAKIASGGVGSVAASSDSAIAHQREAMNSAQTYKAWRAAADAMLKEGHNRIGSIQDVNASLQQQSGSSAAPSPAAPSAVHWNDLK